MSGRRHAGARRLVAVVMLALAAALTGCRFFDDARAPCRAAADCDPAAAEACVSGVCVAGAEGEGEGPPCTPHPPAPVSPCGVDPFGADVTGECTPDLVVGSPGAIVAPAGWGAATGPRGVVQIFRGPAFTQSSELANPADATARAGFGSAIAIDPAGARQQRTLFIGEPASTVDAATAKPNGQAWVFDFVGGAATPFTAAPTAGAGSSVAAFAGPDGPSFAYAAPEDVTALQQAVFVGVPALHDAIGRLQASEFATAGAGRLGAQVKRVADVDGDGFDDVLLSAAGFSDDVGQHAFGAVALTAAGITDSGNNDPLTVVHRWYAPEDGIGFGAALLAVEDVTCDATPARDFLFGAPDADDGRGRVYLDTSSGTDPAGPYVALDTPASLGAGARFGHALERLGDLDGDGFDEIAVGAPFARAGGAPVAACVAAGAQPGYDGDCTGALVVVRGRDLADLAVRGAGHAIASSCVLEGASVGGLFGFALRAVSAGVVAAGAPGVPGSAGKVAIVDVAVGTDGACTLAVRSELTRGPSPVPDDRFGAALGQ